MAGMDLNEIKQQLANYYKQNEKKESSWGKYMVQKAEIPGVFRIVPYRFAKHPFIEIKQHWNIAGERALVCPKHFNGSECPICDLSEKFMIDATFQLSDGTDRPVEQRKNNYAIAQSLRAVSRYHLPVISRSDSSKPVRLIGFPEGIYLKLLGFAADPDYGDYADEDSGRDLTFSNVPQKDGKNKMDVSIKPKQTPLAETPDKIKAIIVSVPNYFEAEPPVWEVKTKAQLLEILSRFGKTNDEKEITISSESDQGPSTSVDVDIQLNAFLKESN